MKKNPDALLNLLLKSARHTPSPDVEAPPWLATRLAARWASGESAASGWWRGWECFTRRAALGGLAAAAVIGFALGDAWRERPAARVSESVVALEIVQLEELIWTP